MEIKVEAESDDVMECLFAPYRTSAELQHGIHLARHLSLLTQPRISAV